VLSWVEWSPGGAPAGKDRSGTNDSDSISKDVISTDALEDETTQTATSVPGFLPSAPH
jgi:hypothetical protein